MQVVILCGGLGARLREETEYKPKPMVFIGDRPILWHIMKIYSSQGFNEFILCLGYKGEVIKDYFYHYELMNHDVTIDLSGPKKIHYHYGDGGEDWKITLVDTGLKALKGARLKKIEKYIKAKEFMMSYGDGVADVDLKKLLAFHHRHKKIATVTGANPISPFGELKVKRNLVENFTEKPKSATRLINSGFFVFNKKIFKYLSEADSCELELGPLEKVAKQKQMMVYKHPGSWACMDTYRDAIFLNKLWRKKQAFWKIWK